MQTIGEKPFFDISPQKKEGKYIEEAFIRGECSDREGKKMKELKRLKSRLAATLIVTMLAASMAPASFAAARSAWADGAEIKFQEGKELSLDAYGEGITLHVVLAEESGGASSSEADAASPSTPGEIGGTPSAGSFQLESVTSSNEALVEVVSWPRASDSELSASAEIEIRPADEPDFSKGRSAVITAKTTAGKTATCTVKVLGADVETTISKSSIEYGGSAEIKAKALYTTGIENAAVSIELGYVYGLTEDDPAEEVSFYDLQEDAEEKEDRVTIYSDPKTGMSGPFTIPVTVTLTGDNIEPQTFEDKVTLTVAEPELKLVAEPSDLKLGRDERAVISIDPECSAAGIEFAGYNWKLVSGEEVIKLPEDAVKAEVEAVITGAGEAEIELTAVVEPKEGPNGNAGRPVELKGNITLTVEEGEPAVDVQAEAVINTDEMPELVIPDGLSQEQVDELKREDDAIKAEIEGLKDFVKNLSEPLKISEEDQKNLSGFLTNLPAVGKDDKVTIGTKMTFLDAPRKVNTEGDPYVDVESMRWDIELNYTIEKSDGQKVQGTTNLRPGKTIELAIPGVNTGIQEEGADLEHAGHPEDTKWYKWSKAAGGRYIMAKASGFSEFKLTFSDAPVTPTPPSPTPSNGGRRSGGGGRSHSYNPSGQWLQNGARWYFRTPNGSRMTNCWSELTWNGILQWYRFDESGYMLTGWFTDVDGNRYFMHDVADGNQGHMYTGWHFIQGSWYYFRDYAGGPKGSLVVNGVTPDGYTTDANGACAAYPGNAAR